MSHHYLKWVLGNACPCFEQGNILLLFLSVSTGTITTASMRGHTVKEKWLDLPQEAESVIWGGQVYLSSCHRAHLLLENTLNSLLNEVVFLLIFQYISGQCSCWFVLMLFINSLKLLRWVFWSWSCHFQFQPSALLGIQLLLGHDLV